MYNVFAMFNNHGGTVVKADITGGDPKEHYTWALVTKDAAAGKLAVMMWNYSDREASIELKLDKLPSAMAGKNILVTRYQIDANHANYYKDYQDGRRGYPRDDQEAEGGGFPVDFKIQGSDDLTTWKDFAVRAGYGNGQTLLGVQSLKFAANRCRHVRILATRLGQVASKPVEYRLQLAELEIYAQKD